MVDRAAGLRAGPAIEVLLEFLQRGEGFVGYGITSDALDADAERIRRSGLEAQEMRLTRQRADGTAVDWRLGLPDGEPWLQTWPFLWWAALVSNQRPLACEASALPLS